MSTTDADAPGEMNDPDAVYFWDEDLYHDSTEIESGEYYKPWNGYGLYQP